MLRCAPVLAFFGFVLAATGAWAAELTGFGPIKFGMTKEEAMAAINGEGRWETNDRLDYSYYWSEFDEKLTVNQFFRKGRAFQVHVFGQSKEPFWYNCVSVALKVVGVIQEKYKISPLIRSGLNNQMKLSRSVDEFVTDTYFFGFDGGAFINVTNSLSADSDDCDLLIHYYPAHRKPHPF